jgi:D-alanine transfer protein
LALQRQAFRQHDLLPIYGSSELMKPIPDKASEFFKTFPSGFSVFPVGKAGATSIILAQKIAAANPAARSKLAISVSPGWFIRPRDSHYYEGNFSHQQALVMVFHPRLSFELKRDLARRLLDYPETLQKDALLRFAAERLAGGTWTDRLLYYVAVPLGQITKGANAAQDHIETLFYIASHKNRWDPTPTRERTTLRWDQLIADSTGEPSPLADMAKKVRRKFDTENTFLKAMNNSQEWKDFDLLLRVMKELHLRPLVLSMPPPTVNLQMQGISPTAVSQYLTRIQTLGRQRRVPVEAFTEHFYDDAFLADTHDHLSVKGWMYYNRALDGFYHSNSKHHIVAQHRSKSGA